MTEKRRLITNTLANGAAQFTAMISAFVFMPFLIRAFGLADYGLYLLAGSVAGYAAVLDFGVGAALAKMVAEKVAGDDHESTATLASTALAFYLLIGVVVALIMFVLAFLAPVLFKVTPDGARLLRNLLVIAGLFALWTWPAATASYVLAGYQRYTITARTSLGVTLGSVAAVLLVLYTHQGPVVLMVLNGLVAVGGTLFNIRAARRQLQGRRVSVRLAQRSVFRSIFMFSWAVFVLQIASIIIYQQTDRLVIGIFLGAAAIGLYEAAGKFQGLIVQLITFAASAVMPTASQLDAQGRRDVLQNLFLRGSKYTVALVTPAIVTLIVLARPLILRWLGPLFLTQVTNAQIFILPQLLMVNVTVGDSIIIGQGALPKRIPYVVAITIGNLVLSVILVQQLGILGVVLGTTIPYFVDYPFHVRLLLRQTETPLRTWLRQVVLPTYPLLLVPLVVAYVTLQTPLMNRLVGIAVAGMLSVLAYWIALYFLGLNSKERGEVAAVLRVVKARAARRGI